ncbi:tRNA uridine(34) 5-carboxymethylaminomethyl synthesis GTPase MnmE [Erysipelotrichaceae bacterium MTC7]|nr:tRNA uridine(34) 5-carboxymethylaminomethyl synthesis GTPase MnmE [Erysipelotrichaceae bacterium MTC7]
MFQDTIVAIATALQQGPIAIVRMSGPDAIEIASTLLHKDLAKKDSHTITYGFIFDPKTGERVDEVLLSLFKAPKTYTGEDMLEINCHGGSYITKEILRLCLENGARMASPGEFSQRGYLNGKMDLTKAEGIHDMVFAQDKNNARMAIQAIQGSVVKVMDPLLEKLLDIIANIEVNIDYPEYDDVELLTAEILLPKTIDLLQDIDEVLRRANSGKILREGIKTAIIGKPNVGKSSLLNALLEEDKAIVSDIEGTTRDIVEGSIRLDNVTLHLIDTAGIRESDDTIEKIGIDRSRKMVEEAALVLVVFDGSQPLDAQDEALLAISEGKERLLIYNKKDEKAHNGINISAKDGDVDALMDALNEKYQAFHQAYQMPMLQNERQLSLMAKAKVSLVKAREALEQGYELDLVTIDLQDAYYSLKEILGEVSKDDLLDTLFSKFCLGK